LRAAPGVEHFFRVRSKNGKEPATLPLPAEKSINLSANRMHEWTVPVLAKSENGIVFKATDFKSDKTIRPLTWFAALSPLKSAWARRQTSLDFPVVMRKIWKVRYPVV
jgi:hypothetical protein